MQHKRAETVQKAGLRLPSTQWQRGGFPSFLINSSVTGLDGLPGAIPNGKRPMAVAEREVPPLVKKADETGFGHHVVEQAAIGMDRRIYFFEVVRELNGTVLVDVGAHIQW